jgi:hypothetical protein
LTRTYGVEELNSLLFFAFSFATLARKSRRCSGDRQNDPLVSHPLGHCPLFAIASRVVPRIGVQGFASP